MFRHSPLNPARWRDLACVAVLLSAVLGPVTVQSASDTATVSAEVVSILSLINQTDMIFGDVAATNSSGTVILSPSGDRLITGGAFVNSTSPSGPAVFDVIGLPNAVYAITLPDSVVLTGASGNSMLVDNFTSQPANTGLTDSGGEQNLFVGGTLNISNNQPIGSYSGIMSVTIVYN